MNSELITVNPKDLTIDLPVDPKNVAEVKKQTLAWGKIHTPIEIWIDPDTEQILIADGFHRTVAAVELGMQEIPALLLQCDKEEFWDKRISQAKKHAAISDDRLHAWIVQAWEMSSIGESAGQGMTDAIYKIHQGLAGSKAFSTDPAYQPVLDWLTSKAEMWGQPAIKVASVVLERENVFHPRAPEAKALSADLELSVKQAGRLTKEIKKQPAVGGIITKAQMRQYAAEVVANDEDITPTQWVQRDKQKQAIRRQAEAQRAQTPSGVEQKKRERIQKAVQSIRDLRVVEHRIDDVLSGDIDEVLAAQPEMLEKINAFLAKAESLAKRVQSAAAVQPVSGAERIALNTKIAQLERAQAPKKQPIIVSRDSMALPGVEISRTSH